MAGRQLRESQRLVERKQGRIERAQADRPVRRMDRLLGSIEIRQNDGAVAEGDGKVGVDHDCLVERAERGVVISGKLRQRQAGEIQHPGIISGDDDRPPRHRDAFLDLRAGGRDPVPLTLHPSTEGNAGHRRAISGIEVEGEPRQPDRLRHALAVSFVRLRLGAPVKIVGVKRSGRFANGALGFGNAQPRFDRADDAARHPVLQFEDIVEGAVEAVGPDMRARRRVNQLPAMRTRWPAFLTEPSSR